MRGHVTELSDDDKAKINCLTLTWVHWIWSMKLKFFDFYEIFGKNWIKKI
jgi:hypothetical protein